ncbi:MAG TPA: hypothetical protein VGG98_09515 [Solirubrobacteraceae bacterium]|jgi:hypothetical protein
MSRRALRLLLAVCVLAAAWLISKDVIGSSVGFLFLAPAVLLALPLLAGRYIGAERLRRIARTRSPHRRRASAASRAPRAWGLVPPRGGLLIAASLAVRPPPVVRSAH